MGPLHGVKIIEVGGIGPGPFCGMMLSDMGADVIRIERKGHSTRTESKYDVMMRNRRSMGIDLRKPEGAEIVLAMLEKADALLVEFAGSKAFEKSFVISKNTEEAAKASGAAWNARPDRKAAEPVLLANGKWQIRIQKLDTPSGSATAKRRLLAKFFPKNNP